MTTARFDTQELARSDGNEQRWPRDLRAQGESSVGSGALITGLVVLGLGLLAWYYLGPDLRRYLKLRSM